VGRLSSLAFTVLGQSYGFRLLQSRC